MTDNDIRAIADLRRKDQNNRISEKTVAREEGRAEERAKSEKEEMARGMLSLGLNRISL